MCYTSPSESSQRAALANVFLWYFSPDKSFSPEKCAPKIFSHNHPWQIKNVFCKKISEIFDLFFFLHAYWQDLMCSAMKIL